MAVTKWLDPTPWTIAEWEDDTNTVLLGFLWNALKGAVDERQAYAELTHSGGFDADFSFPDLATVNNLALAGPDDPNNLELITNSLMPDELGTGGTGVLSTVETSTIKADGTAIASAEANYLTYAEILTGPLGYASGQFLHLTGSSTGTNTAITQMAWVVQWYKYMAYTQYFIRQVQSGFDDFFDEIETRRMVLTVGYDYNSTTSTFIGATAIYTNAPNAPAQKYVANDLNETAPFSSEQDVWDYTVATFDAELSGADWVSASGTDGVQATAQMQIIRDLGPDDITQYEAGIEQKQFRFKVNESFRAASPAKFQSALHFYFYISDFSIFDFSALGVGLDEDESQFNELVADGSGWYYLEPVTAPDFDVFTPPTRPAGTDTVFKAEGYQSLALNNEGGGHDTDIFIETNDPAGTAFLYYNP